MATDAELEAIVLAIRSIEGRFKSSQALGLILELDDESEFRRLAVEAKASLAGPPRAFAL